ADLEGSVHMKSLVAALLATVLVVSVGVAQAAGVLFNLTAGQSGDITCETTCSVTQTASNTVHISAAPATSARTGLVWLVPQVTGLGQSAGYDPGTDWAAVMYACGAWWHGQDDENTWTIVQFPQPTEISGFRFNGYAASGAGPGTVYPTTVEFRDTTM